MQRASVPGRMEKGLVRSLPSSNPIAIVTVPQQNINFFKHAILNILSIAVAISFFG